MEKIPPTSTMQVLVMREEAPSRHTLVLSLIACALAMMILAMWTGVLCPVKLHRRTEVDERRGTHAYPVILIPGDGGNQVEAKLNKTGGPHYFCTRHTNYW